MDRPTPKTFEVVVQPDEGATSILFDHAGSAYVAADPSMLGRWALDLARDVRTPSVEFNKGGRWLELGKRLLESAGVPSEAPDADLVAVHLLVQVTLDDEGDIVTAAVYPPAGRLRVATDVEKLGQVLDALARDEAQPRVPPGAPPNPFESFAEQAAKALLQ